MKLSAISKKVMKTLCALLLLLVAASAAYYRSFAFLPFAFGVLLGAAVNVLKVILLDHTVSKIVDMGAKSAENYVRFQHFLRFLLTGLMLLLSALLPFINIWGTAAGLCTMQVALFFVRRARGAMEKSDDAVG